MVVRWQQTKYVVLCGFLLQVLPVKAANFANPGLEDVQGLILVEARVERVEKRGVDSIGMATVTRVFYGAAPQRVDNHFF